MMLGEIIYRRDTCEEIQSSKEKYCLNRQMLIATDSRVEARRIRNQNFALRYQLAIRVNRSTTEEGN